MGGQGGLQAVRVNPSSHGCRGDGVQEELVGGVGHHSISVTVQWEARVGKLHPGVAHLQKIVRRESLVAARFGHLEALQRKRVEEAEERQGQEEGKDKEEKVEKV